MKSLKRNQQTFYYKLYQGETPVYEDGEETGEVEITYSSWTQYKGNISPAVGESQIEQFGNSEQYDRIIVIDNLECPIDENSVLLLDETPEDDETPFNYIVKRKAVSLNSISYGITKVEVSE